MTGAMHRMGAALTSPPMVDMMSALASGISFGRFCRYFDPGRKRSMKAASTQ